MDKFIRSLVLFLCGGILLYGQGAVADYDGTASNVSRGPAIRDYTTRFFYSGSNLVFACVAPSAQPTKTWSISAGNLSSISIASNVATVTWPANHGLYTNNQITISGGSITPFNGVSYKLTFVTDTTATFSVTWPNVTVTSGLTITTTAPRTIDPIWKITQYVYSVSSVVAIQNSDFRKICDNRAATGINEITYR